MPRHPWGAVVLAATLTAGAVSHARADTSVTGFLGFTTTPSIRGAQGLAVSFKVLIVAIEVEYTKMSADLATDTPSLMMGTVGVIAQTPFVIKRLQFYGTIGGGIYHEALGDYSKTHVGVDYGGGVKISLAGPVRARVDYRLFDLRGSARTPRPQRLYAGLMLEF